MKTNWTFLAAVVLAAYFGIALIGYLSPYERCVRATMEDTKFPTDEVGARLTCARAFSKY